MKRHNIIQHQSIKADGWKAFSQTCFDLSALDIGPHSKTLLQEIIGAVKAGLPVSVIILAATIADVVLYEGQIDPGQSPDADSMGIDWLTASERRQLNWLRSYRNQLVHYEGVVSGMTGAETDQELMQKNADKALAAIVPLLDGLEQF